MKRRTIGESVEIVLTVPTDKSLLVQKTIIDFFELAGHKVKKINAGGEELFNSEEVFPGSKPGDMVKGLRVRENITQKEMAEKLGIRQHHISEMEKGVRPITLEMAKKIGRTFNVSYKVFL